MHNEAMAACLSSVANDPILCRLLQIRPGKFCNEKA